MKYNRFYYDYDRGIVLKDAVLYTDVDAVARKPWRKIVVNDADYTLCTITTSLKTPTPKQHVTVPRGESIYCTPELPVSINDVRKFYKIKRSYKDASYAVVSSKQINHFGRLSGRSLFVAPSRNAAFLSSGSYIRQDFLNFARQYVPDIQLEELKESLLTTVYFYDCAEIYKDILDETITVPIVSSTCLNLVSENKVTTDLLNLVYCASKTNVKDLIIQLKILNQHNWQEYPLTMNILRDMMRQHKPYIELTRSPSCLPKEVRNLITSMTGGFTYSPMKEDFELLQAFVKSVIQLDNTKFVSMYDAATKFYNLGLSLSVYQMLFNPIVKLSSPSYEEFIKQKENCGAFR